MNLLKIWIRFLHKMTLIKIHYIKYIKLIEKLLYQLEDNIKFNY